MSDAVILIAKARNGSLTMSKAVRFTSTTTVKEAMHEIAEKCSISTADNVLQNCVLVIPPKNPDDEPKYLRDLNSNVLSMAPFQNRDEIQLHEVAHTITVTARNSEDHQFKNIDLEIKGSEFLALVCKHYGYSTSDYELSCIVPGKQKTMLEKGKCLIEQGFTSGTVATLSKKQKNKLKFTARKTKTKSSNIMVSEPMFVKHTRNERMEEDDEKFEIFGHPLVDALQTKEGPPLSLPHLITSAIEYIEARALNLEGIFRVSGKSWLVDKLKEDCDNALTYPDFDGIEDPHLVCAVLKLYLRELPEPVIPFAQYDSFLSIGQIALDENRMDELVTRLANIPRENYFLLRRLMLFLYKVAAHSAVNKMNIRNLATIFGPNILRPEDETDMMKMVNDSVHVTAITVFLIENGSKLFPTPNIPTAPKPPIRLKSLELMANDESIEFPSRSIPALSYALFSYGPDSSMELSFDRGDLLLIIDDLQSGWSFGKVIVPVSQISASSDSERQTLLQAMAEKGVKDLSENDWRSCCGFFPKHLCTDFRVYVRGMKIPHFNPPTIVRTFRVKNTKIEKPSHTIYTTVEMSQERIDQLEEQVRRLEAQLLEANLRLESEVHQRHMFEVQALYHINSLTGRLLGQLDGRTEAKKSPSADSSAEVSAQN